MLPVCATRCKCATCLQEAGIVAERQHVRRTNLCRCVNQNAARRGRNRPGLGLPGGPSVGDEGGDCREGTEVLDFHVVQLDAEPEALLELHQQLDEPHRVEPSGREQVGVGRRHFDTEPLGKQRGQLGLQGIDRRRLKDLFAPEAVNTP